MTALDESVCTDYTYIVESDFERTADVHIPHCLVVTVRNTPVRVGYDCSYYIGKKGSTWLGPTVPVLCVARLRYGNMAL
jgi:hypothetical protein